MKNFEDSNLEGNKGVNDISSYTNAWKISKFCHVRMLMINRKQIIKKILGFIVY